MTTSPGARTRSYTLIGADGADGAAFASARPGTLGGHRRNCGYGRLDCPSALRWLARGMYARHRVFFADETSAVAAGYRPCARCLPGRYAVWKAAQRGTGSWPDEHVGRSAEVLGRSPSRS